MDTEYLEAVLDAVEEVPPGRVVTYGALAELVGDRLEAAGLPRRGGPRQVGAVLALAGGGVPWWRVVNARGEPPARHRTRALAHLRDEGVPLTGDDDGARVRLSRAAWGG